MDRCELCAKGAMTHPDDFVRIVIDERSYGRPMYLCPRCLRKIQRCYLCRWYNEDLKKCFEGPFTVTKKPKDGCGHWKQDEPVFVKENSREEVERGCPKFALV